jgi:ATP-binding cassette subfamily B protein
MSNHKKNLKLAASYFSPYKWGLVGVFLFSCVTASSILWLGKGIEYLIDRGIVDHNSRLLDYSALILILIILVLSVATYLRSFLINSIAEKIIAKLREDVYKNIINISPSYFESGKTSDIISRLTTDTTLLSAIIGSVLSSSLRNLFMAIGGMILLFMTSLKLTIYTLCVVPLVLSLIIYFGKKVRKISKVAQSSVADLTEHIEETINGIRVVQSNNRQLYEIDRFIGKIDFSLSSVTNWIRLKAIMMAFAIFVIFLAVVVAILIGGNDVIAGEMSPGKLTSFILYSVLVASSIGGLTETVSDVQRAIASTERLLELLTIKSDILSPKKPIILKQGNYPIKFENISFHYPSRPNILANDDLNFEINPGETVALVGPSGSGKSTIFQLILRFYDPTQGKITLAGHDIRDLSLENLRSFFAYVPQDPTIFSTTAYENICYGISNATIDQVREAAKSANILDFIDSLPQGMDSFLGEKGIRISGGEKQRIAIARSILRNPKILLLDEATSSLDTQNEYLVQSSIDKLMEGRTTIIIAHRLSTIINADKIIVLNNGKIDSIGTHQELLQMNGLYSHLVALKK